MSKLSNLATKALTEVKENIKKLVKRNVKVYNHLNADENLLAILNGAADLKAKIDVVGTQLKSLEAEYEPLKEIILKALPGEKIDKFESIIEGIQVKKYSQVRGAGKIDQDKMIELLRNKKLLTKATKTIRVIDEDAVHVAIVEGIISLDEYKECISEGTVSQVLKLERKFYPQQAIGEGEVKVGVPQ